MTRPRRRAVAVFALGFATGGLAACQGRAGGPEGCAAVLCPAEAVCHLGACLRRGAAGDNLALVVTPPDSLQYAPTEVDAVGGRPIGEAIAAGPVTLQVEPTVVVGGEVDGLGGVSMVGSRLLFQIPSGLSGRPDRLIELEADSRATGQAVFSLRLAPGELGRTARVTVVPQTPTDRLTTPYATTVTLDDGLDVAPSEGWLLAWAKGQVRSPLDQPLPNQSVRIFRQGRLASTVGTTDATGAFALRLAWHPPAPEAPPLVVEVRPPAAIPGPVLTKTVPEPTAIADPTVAGAVDAGTIRQPAAPAAAAFTIPLLGYRDGRPDATIGDALIDMETTLVAGPDTTARFQSSGVTGEDGVVKLALLPGLANMPRLYELAVRPGAGVPWARSCHPAYAVSWTPGTMPTVRTGPRPRVDVQLIHPGGTIRLDGIGVTATTLGPSSPEGCGGADDPGPGAPTTAVTARDGRFEMFLDVGRLRIDYLPPPGLPMPRFSEVIEIPSDAERGWSHTSKAPSGALTEGRVTNRDGQGLGGALVRLIRLTCEGAACSDAAGSEPVAESWTDETGTFRMVTPAP